MVPEGKHNKPLVDSSIRLTSKFVPPWPRESNDLRIKILLAESPRGGFFKDFPEERAEGLGLFPDLPAHNSLRGVWILVSLQLTPWANCPPGGGNSRGRSSPDLGVAIAVPPQIPKLNRRSNRRFRNSHGFCNFRSSPRSGDEVASNYDTQAPKHVSRKDPSREVFLRESLGSAWDKGGSAGWPCSMGGRLQQTWRKLGPRKALQGSTAKLP